MPSQAGGLRQRRERMMGAHHEDVGDFPTMQIEGAKEGGKR
jgi:hypothetical protein